MGQCTLLGVLPKEIVRMQLIAQPHHNCGSLLSLSAPTKSIINETKMPTWWHNEYTIGWICALPLEMAAARAMLDKVHPKLQQSQDDHSTYVLGEIAGHNVVIACLPSASTGLFLQPPWRNKCCTRFDQSASDSWSVSVAASHLHRRISVCATSW